MTEERFYIDTVSTDYFTTLSVQEKQLISSVGVKGTDIFAEIIGHLAETYRRTGQYRKALKFFYKSFNIWLRLGEESRAAWCLWGIASTFRLLGAYTESIVWYRRAISLSKSKERRCLIWSHAGIAEVFRIIGKYKEALQYHNDILEAFRLLKDMKGMGWGLAGIGQILKLTGNRQRALELFIQSESVARNNIDTVGIAYALRGQSEISKSTGDLEIAESKAIEAIKLFSAVGYDVGLAYATKSMSEIKLSQGSIEVAHDLALKSLNLFEKYGKRRGIAYALKALGDVKTRMLCLDEALGYYQRADKIFREIKIQVPHEYKIQTGVSKVQCIYNMKKTFIMPPWLK